jgi:hypothetical protein
MSGLCCIDISLTFMGRETQGVSNTIYFTLNNELSSGLRACHLRLLLNLHVYLIDPNNIGPALLESLPVSLAKTFFLSSEDSERHYLIESSYFLTLSNNPSQLGSKLLDDPATCSHIQAECTVLKSIGGQVCVNRVNLSKLVLTTKSYFA